MRENIPRATIRRLPIYFRYLQLLSDQGEERVSSTELSKAVHIDSATIRRDLSYFGALGKRGYGYEIQYLIDFLGHVLNQNQVTRVAVVGAGNLGSALLRYKFHKNCSMVVAVAFDVNPQLIGTEIDGVPVYSTDELEERLAEFEIDVVILTVNQEGATRMMDRLMETKIKGILNFTPLRFEESSHIKIENVDLTNELQTLIYYIDQDV